MVLMICAVLQMIYSRVESDGLEIPPVVRDQLEGKDEGILRHDGGVEDIEEKGNQQLDRRSQVKDPRG